MISAEFPFKKLFKKINEKEIAYLDIGKGDPIILIHGNPTSSYLWRNIIPGLINCGRLIVPDLIGHGDSEKLPLSDGPNRYSFLITYEYLCGLFKSLGLNQNITFVLHDWGGGLGFHWAKTHPNSVKGIAYMETIVCPIKWDDWPKEALRIFKGFRSNKGEDLILKRNLFIESVLKSAIKRKLSEQEMRNYREPFKIYHDRQPVLNWPRQIPISGEPHNMVLIVENYAKWMMKNSLPKLFINADPGSILIGKQREFCRKWHNQTEVTVQGIHFIQEDSPVEISNAIFNWIKTL